MKELPITGDDVENALHSVSENLTEAINRHGQLPEIKERLERLSPKKRFLRADFIRNDFLKIETEILRLKDISKPHYPQRNIFTGEPEGQEEAPLMNFTTHQYALLNYFLSQTRNFIDLLSNMIGNEILCSLESPMKDDSLQSQNESIRTLKETESKIIKHSSYSGGTTDGKMEGWAKQSRGILPSPTEEKHLQTKSESRYEGAKRK